MSTESNNSQSLDALYQSAHKLWINDNLGAARDQFQTLIARARIEENSMELARALNDLASVELSSGESNRAFELYHESLNLARIIGQPRQIAATLCNMSNLYRGQGYASEAEEALLEALTIFRSIDLKPGASVVLGNLAGMAIERTDLVKGSQMMLEAIELDRETGDARMLSSHLSDYAQAVIGMGNINVGITALQESLNVANSHQLKKETAYANARLADAFIQLQQFDRAEQHALDALAIARSTDLPSITGTAIITLGQVYRNLGRLDEARLIVEEGIDLYRKTESIRTKVNVHHLLGDIEFFAGNYSAAINHYFITREAAESIHLDSYAASVVFKMGMVHELTSEKIEAIGHYRDALINIDNDNDTYTHINLLSRLVIVLRDVLDPSANQYLTELQQKVGLNQAFQYQLSLLFSETFWVLSDHQFEAAIENFRKIVALFEANNINPHQFRSLELKHLIEQLQNAGIEQDLLPLPSNWKK